MSVGTIIPLILMIISEFYSNSNLDFMLGEFVLPSNKDWIFIGLLEFFSTYAINIYDKKLTLLQKKQGL